ncbi:MAG: hypothetical protein IJ618_00170 [Prevotella sp.]|nr:hypothetical protein [Prevotella sp.]MBR1502284.1 hypothetical protein [Prevotella sp.]
MAITESVYKGWDDKIDELSGGDFKDGVLKAIRRLKEEVYNLKVDNFNQQMGRVIRDDKRIVLSAPEIIIGDVNLGGVLNPGSESRVVIRGTDVSLQGAGDVGRIGVQAPLIEQVAENPGIDGNEHVVGEISKIISQATNIAIQSDKVEKDGAFPTVSDMTGSGIRIKSDCQVDIRATASRENLLLQIDKRINSLKSSKKTLEDDLKKVKGEFKQQREEIDSLLGKKSRLAKKEEDVRTDYHDMDELNIRIEELSMSLTETIFKYSNLLSMTGENERLLKYFSKRKEEVSKVSADDFKKHSTNTAVNVVSETLNLTSMDADGNVRTNAKAGVNVLTNAMKVAGDTDEKGSLLDSNKLSVNMKRVDITTAGSADMEADDKDVLTKAQYKNEGDVVIRSKNITLESVDYEIADKKYKEKGLTQEGKIKLRSKTIEASTVNSKDVDVDEKGKMTKATYTSEGDVIINSKTVSVKAIDTQLDGGNTKETALTKDSSFTVRTERSQFSSTDTEGKATGSMSINAKAIDVKSMDVEKEKRTDSKLAQGGTIKTAAEKMYVGAFSKDLKSKMIQTQSEEIGLFADKTLEAQQGDGKAAVQLSDGKAAVSGSETNVYGKTTINAQTEIKVELKVPKATIDSADIKTSLKTPSITDGMGGAPGTGGNFSRKLKPEDAPKQ